MTRLTILQVAYTLAPCGPDAAGGAEQVLATLDRALVAHGHRSIVIGCHGSHASGELIEVAVAPHGETLDDARQAAAQAAFRATLAQTLQRIPVDLVHLHGFDFHVVMPPPGVPVLATLHLPPDWYSPDALRPTRPHTWLHGVTAHQHAACPPHPRLLPPIPNGVDTAALGRTRHARRRFLLNLARICPEKGTHLALDAAHRAVMPLLVAGEAFPYPAHQAYLTQSVLPRLDRWRRWIGPVGFARKRRLLSAACGLLIPSLAPETSSLVAMEAAACGTPVIAFGNGALPGIVKHGMTGFIVQDMEQMASAIADLPAISPDACRAHAWEQFSQDRMVARYLQRYRACIAETLAAA